MKQGMSLQELLTQVTANAKAKRDFVASTAGAVRMIAAKGFRNDVAVILLRDGAAELERFEVNDTAHGQIAAHLGIPWKYYQRLLTDHADLVINQVNALFEREPSMRLLRTINGHVRAFLSDRYQRLDNDTVLATTLPVLTSAAFANELLSCNVSDERLDVKCVYTDPALEFDVGTAPDGKSRDIVKPGFHLSNSEVGKGSLRARGFFYRAYCRNGAVYGGADALEFSRAHLGGRLIEGSNFQVISDETKRLDDAAIVSGVTDVLKALGSREFVADMAAQLRALKSGGAIEAPVASFPAFARELELTETESASALEALIRDRDYSRWGLLNAVTALANDAPSYERANELEALADKVITMPVARWNQLRVAERVPVAA
jgi:hypothetical protein